MGMASSSTGGKEQWIDAAYSRFESAGLRAIKVEALARDLGATKGSFYWHFTDRAALIAAVMVHWEQLETDQIIVATTTSAQPLDRVQALFAAVIARHGTRGGERTLYIDAETEGVSDTVARVTTKRIEYLASLLVQLGIDGAEAQRRSVLALAIVLGLMQLPQLSTYLDADLAESAMRIAIS